MDLVTYLANLIEYSNLLYIIKIGLHAAKAWSVRVRNQWSAGMSSMDIFRIAMV